MAAPRLLVVFTLAVVGVVLIIVALSSNEWWILVPALLAHGLATAVALGAIGKSLKQREKPDPVTQARLEEEGSSPEGGDPDDRGDEPRMAI